MLAFLLAALTQVTPAAPQSHAGHAHAAPAPRPAAQPDKALLGAMKPGEQRTFEWEVRNPGTKPVLFKLVAPPAALRADGLALAKPWAPGESRRIAFTLDGTGLRGPHAWVLQLKADDPSLPVLSLPVEMVGVAFSVTPDKVTSLGSIGPREVRTTTWELKNLGETPMGFRLLDLAPGVRVTEGPLATPFAPGESRTLSMSIDPTGFAGYQRRAAKLEASDQDQPRYILRTDMTVRPEMSVDSHTKRLHNVKPFESPEAVFAFAREGGDMAQIKLLTALPPYLESEVIHQGAKAELRLTLRPKRLKPGAQAGLELLQVETNAPREPKFSLTLDWRLFLPILPEPARVIFEDLQAPSQTLTLKSAEGKPFRLLKVELEGEGFAVGTFPKGLALTSGLVGPLPTEAAVSFTLPVWLLAKDEIHAVLKVTCDGLDDPLRIPLAFLPPSAPPPAQPVADPRP